MLVTNSERPYTWPLASCFFLQRSKIQASSCKRQVIKFQASSGKLQASRKEVQASSRKLQAASSYYLHKVLAASV
jgi:hypothetical protein